MIIINVQITKPMHVQINKVTRMNEGTSMWVNEWMNEWMNERTNKQINE